MFDNETLTFAKQLLSDACELDSRFDYYMNIDHSYDTYSRLLRDNVISNICKQLSQKYGKLIEPACGATRLVIVVKQSFVIKTNFGSPEFQEYPDHPVDYSYSEYSTYRKACDNHIQECFAECDILLDNICGEWYIMEYCSVDEEYVKSSARRLMSEDYWAYDYYDDEEDTEELAATFLCDSWGSDIYGIYDDFRWDMNINDIHTANIGLSLDDKWKVIDYAGYFN